MCIRSEISTSNKYHIPKHRYLELKHFCLQYPEWLKLYLETDFTDRSVDDPTGEIATLRASVLYKKELLEKCAAMADEEFADAILKHVCYGLSYENLQTTRDLYCSRDTFYNRCRRFYWFLNSFRE